MKQRSVSNSFSVFYFLLHDGQVFAHIDRKCYYLHFVTIFIRRKWLFLRNIILSRWIYYIWSNWSNLPLKLKIIIYENNSYIFTMEVFSLSKPLEWGLVKTSRMFVEWASTNMHVYVLYPLFEEIYFSR